MFAERLKQLRMQSGRTRKDVARYVNKSVSSISNYENGIRKPSDDKTWIKLATLFNVSVDYLMGDNDKENSNHTFQCIDNTTKTDVVFVDTIELPILGDVAAGRVGNYSDIVTYSDNTQRVPMDWISDGQEYILMRVKGDSMEPRFEENDLLFARFQTSVDSGSFAIVWVEDEGGLIKKIVYGEDWIELHSLNPTYPVRRFEGADVMQVRVVGLVKKSIRNY